MLLAQSSVIHFESEGRSTFTHPFCPVPLDCEVSKFVNVAVSPRTSVVCEGESFWNPIQKLALAVISEISSAFSVSLLCVALFLMTAK